MTAESIKFDVKNSKCINNRFSESNCEECVNVCSREAITLTNTVEINSAKCTDCLLCTSVCKTEALDANIAINKLYTISKKQKHLLIGCTKTISVHNYRKSCIGWLSEEYLIFLAFLFPEGVKIDLTSCINCENMDSCEIVKTRVAKLKNENNLGNDFPIELIYSSNDIPKYVPKVTRRDFFTGMNRSIKNEIANYISEDPVNMLNYGNTSLPNRQNAVLYLLNSENQYKEYVASHFNYHVSNNFDCNYCEECSAVCPVNALTVDEVNKTFKFNTERCVGCGLCELFCDLSAINFNKATRVL